MRKELKDFDWHVYGLDISDFDNTLNLIKEIIQDRDLQLKQKIENLELYNENGKLIDIKSEDAFEAIDDISYYYETDNLFLWHFGLWRLQGIFEGILKQNYFPNKRLIGLKSKLEFVRKKGIVIEESDFQELIDWGNLRNALSHFPPEQYRPSGLNEDDLVEYCDLVRRVIVAFNNQNCDKEQML